jgi:hypothetical protein
MPRFYYNRSGRFESRFPTVTVSAPRFSAATLSGVERCGELMLPADDAGRW